MWLSANDLNFEIIGTNSDQVINFHNMQMDHTLNSNNNNNNKTVLLKEDTIYIIVLLSGY